MILGPPLPPPCSLPGFLLQQQRFPLTAPFQRFPEIPLALVVPFTVPLAVPDMCLISDELSNGWLRILSLCRKNYFCPYNIMLYCCSRHIVVVIAGHWLHYAPIYRQEPSPYHDALTGILNRNGLEYRAGQLLRAYNPKHNTALFVINLGDFKKINDRLGHQTEDAVLQQMARRCGMHFGSAML